MAATVAPTVGPLIRSEMEVRDRGDGTQEVVAVRQFASVDGEWIDVRDLIAEWRARPTPGDLDAH